MKLPKKSLGSIAAVLALAVPTAQHFEGKSNTAYLDPVGIPTVCYGYTHGVSMQTYKTDEECDALLDSEMRSALGTVDRLVIVPLSDQERAAYADFVYNVGSGNFSSSTLLREVNAGNRVQACSQLRRWVYGTVSGKKVKLPGLVKRRSANESLCLEGAE